MKGNLINSISRGLTHLLTKYSYYPNRKKMKYNRLQIYDQDFFRPLVSRWREIYSFCGVFEDLKIKISEG